MKKTVILIDDDSDDLDILKEVIESMDDCLVCICFLNSQEAIKAIITQHVAIPDFVITDFNMPGKNGHQCVKELRGMKEFDNTVIAVLSTSMQKDVARSLKDSGANITLEKPVRFDEYRALLSKVFYQKEEKFSSVDKSED